jgi:hypothetical protein
VFAGRTLCPTQIPLRCWRQQALLVHPLTTARIKINVYMIISAELIQYT